MRELPQFKTLILVAIAEEANAFLEVAPEIFKASNLVDGLSVNLWESGDDNNRILLAEVGVGIARAALVSGILLQKIKVERIILAGLAGGLSEGLELGDVIVSTKVIQHDSIFSSRSGLRCIRPGRPMVSKPENRSHEFTTSSAILNACTDLIAKPTKNGGKVVTGVFVSGSEFMCDPSRKVALRERIPEAIGIDMEAAGVMISAEFYNVDAVVIKAVSDGVQPRSHRGLVADFKESIQLAAASAAEVALALCRNIESVE